MATNVDDADHNDSGSGSDSDSVDTIDFDNLDLDRFEDEDDEAAARLPPILLRRPLAWGAETNRKFVAILSLLEIPDSESDEENESWAECSSTLPLEIPNSDSDPDFQL
ncbi:hypothetical protein M431DRAFT_477724 [Trichoderma harzianum CBS 226.95]|uniref:Uncharacterized protein n=1 Tax=Trichoderma harzianum CBS 226.95 TaxID=983964 RepID=A0A2T4ANL5_TRIHA|nr:hypothetical protein M431DRAFT_477724 [Trichoderma harzianum CBS 226.95]PTB58508.1 hypothetical protein M431DRAFT_477724 [Trichoderma harzianum CBS 226.95]